MTAPELAWHRVLAADALPESQVRTVVAGHRQLALTHHDGRFFGRYFECRRQSVLMSGYLGSIGFGYPAAMGAWAAAPDRPTVGVTGDGSFGQYLAELTTAVKYGMKITQGSRPPPAWRPP